MLIDCFIKVGVPKGLQNYISSKKELYIKQGLGEKDSEIKALNKFKNETANHLADLHKQIGNEKFVTKTEDTMLSEEDANQNTKPAIITPTEVKSIQSNEVVPPKEGEESKGTYLQYPPTSLSYRGTDKIETEFGTDTREPTVVKHDIETMKEADNLIEKGWNVKDAIGKIESGEHVPSDAEYINMTRYAAELSDRLRNIDKLSPEYDKTLQELNRVAKASNMAGKEQGRGLGIRGRFKTVKEGTYEDFMLDELAANNEADLTIQQKETASTQFEKLQKEKEYFQDKTKELAEKASEQEAEKEFEKIKKSTSKKTKKTHEDFVKERKNAVEKAREALKKLRTGESGLSAVPIPGIRELIAIAPHVKKALLSLAEEGAIKLADAVKQLYEDFKEFGITEKHIHDIIAGEYNEKKPTKREALIRAENLRIEAGLINKLEKLQSLPETKNENLKVKRNQEIESLRKQIKDFKKDNPDYEAQLKQIKSKNEKETAKIKEKITEGNFEPERKRTPLLEDKEIQKKYPDLFKEVQKSRDELIKTKKEIELRRLRQQYENRTPQEKFQNTGIQVLNVPRTLMASMDFSAPLRQGLVASAAHPVLAARAAKFMLEATKDEKVYNRWLDDVHKSPRWEAASKSELAITDPSTLHLKEKEEAFLGSGLAEQIPLFGPLVKGSERAYVGFLNKIRWDLFNQYADVFESKGKTIDNNPELYKGLASFVNASTGRGGMSFGGAAAPLMSSVLFSPRLIASRMNMLGLSDIPNLMTRIGTLGKRGVDYGFYTKLPKEIRIEAAKDMLKFVAVGLTTLALAKMGFGAEVEDDPRSTDFGKIKSGNTRWDIWGGFQPYARVISQLVTGERKSANTGKVYSLEGNGAFGQDRGDVIATFGRGKLAPVPSLIWDVIKGRTAVGEKINRKFDIPFVDEHVPNEITLTDEVKRHVLPLVLQDVVSAMKDKGVSALFSVGIPSTFGVGVNTYQPRQSSSKSNKPSKQKTTTIAH